MQRPRREFDPQGTQHTTLGDVFGSCGLSVGKEQPSFPQAGGCGPVPHSLVWDVRVGRPRLLGRTALGCTLATGRQSGLPTHSFGYGRLKPY